MSSLSSCHKCEQIVSDEEKRQDQDGRVYHQQCLEMVLCTHCGEEIQEEELELDDGKRSYHIRCKSDEIDRCLKAVKAFTKLCSPTGHVLFMAIHVHVSHGKCTGKCTGKCRDKQKTKRKVILGKLLDRVSALRNSNSGALLIQLVGLSPDDTYIGALDALVDRELNQLIDDDRLFYDVFTKRRMSDKKGFEDFKEFIVLSVEASPTITTSDFKTKISLDKGLENPSPRVVFRFLQRKRRFEEAFPEITLIQREDVKAFHESRSVQMKSCSENMIDKNSNDGILINIFNERKLPEYVSAFTKNADGGMFLFGVREDNRKYTEESYISKTINPHGIKLQNVNAVTKGIEERMSREILACDYSGGPINAKDIIKVDTVPVADGTDDHYVIRVLVKPVRGLVFHDKDGPVAYRVDASDTQMPPCIVRIETSKWLSQTSTSLALTERIRSQDEKQFDIHSTDHFRPALKQIGESVFEIKSHVLDKGGICVKPAVFESSLAEIKEDLLQRLEDKKSILQGRHVVTHEESEIEGGSEKGFVFLAESLPVALNFEAKDRPANVQCDIFIVLPNQPPIVLTLTDDDKQSEDVNIYNTSVMRGLILSLTRFLNVSFKTVFGVLNKSDIKTTDSFNSNFASIIQTSKMFLSLDALSMNLGKYDKVMTAFCASMAETTSVFSKPEDKGYTYLRFLTREQGIVILENLNKQHVNVTTRPGSGATTLMLEIARRLSRLVETLLVVKSEDDIDKLRLPHLNIMCASELQVSDRLKYKQIVDESSSIQPDKDIRLWTFTPEKVTEDETVFSGLLDQPRDLKEEKVDHPEEAISGLGKELPKAFEDIKNVKLHSMDVKDDPAVSVAVPLVKAVHVVSDVKPKQEAVVPILLDPIVTIKQEPTETPDSSDVAVASPSHRTDIPPGPRGLKRMNIEYLERPPRPTRFKRERQVSKSHKESGVHIYHVGQGDSSRPVSCPPMTLDSDRVNSDKCQVTENGKLRNSPRPGKRFNEGFRNYWGTCNGPSSDPIHLPSTVTMLRYWETETRVRVGEQASEYWRPLLEMGVSQVGVVDKKNMVSFQRHSWAVSVDVCVDHRPGMCTRVFGEGEQVGDCRRDTMSNTDDTTAVLHYGVVLDVEKGTVAFIDLDREIVLHRFHVKFTEPLRPMFGVGHSPSHTVEMRLVSGREIKMTDTKKDLISQALTTT